MTSLTYLGTVPLPDAWFASLGERLPDVRILRVDVAGGREPDAEQLGAVDFLHTSSWFPQPVQVPHLRCIQLDTSGIDHVRSHAVWNSPIPITTLGGLAPVPMAEYALMSILQLAHHETRIEAARRDRCWPDAATRLRDLTPAPLDGATLTIIGYGRIGREVARLAEAFGMRTIGVRRGASRVRPQFDGGRSTGRDSTRVVSVDALAQVLAESDYVVVVVPRTPATENLLDEAMLSAIKPGAALVNMARGGIVDEQALRRALRSGALRAAVLDVFDTEPLPPDSPWWSEPNVLVTPHVAGLTSQYLTQTLGLVVENITRLASGRPLLNEADRVAGY